MEYDEAVEPWHELLLGKEMAPGRRVVQSTDGVEWVQDLWLSADVKGVLLGNLSWTLPSGLGARHGVPVYRFSAKPSRAKIDDFLSRNDAVIAEQVAADAEGDGAKDDAKPAASTALVDRSSPKKAKGVKKPEAGGLAAMKFDEGEWITVLGAPEPAGTILDSDQVKERLPVTVLGGWALCYDESEESVVVLKKVPIGKGETFLDEASQKLRRADKGGTPRKVDDARILPVARNKAGKRLRTFAEQVLKMSKEEFPDHDWGLLGPRSAPRCLTEYAKVGSSLVTRSFTWRHESNIAEHSHVGQIHELVSEAIDLLITVDQLDGFNLTGVESLVRVLQYHECEVRKKREAKAPPDGSRYFRSRGKATGGCVLDPELLKWIAAKAGQDSAILKETRKAAEEATLSRKGKKDP